MSAHKDGYAHKQVLRAVPAEAGAQYRPNVTPCLPTARRDATTIKLFRPSLALSRESRPSYNRSGPNPRQYKQSLQSNRNVPMIVTGYHVSWFVRDITDLCSS